jgi:DNA-binding NarL/FixJ family response regulator
LSVRVLIVDDHPVVRTGIRGMLEGQPDFVVVGEATNGEEAVNLVGRLDPDVVLMDLRMPGGTDGVAATVRLPSSAAGASAGSPVLVAGTIASMVRRRYPWRSRAREIRRSIRSSYARPLAAQSSA